MHLHLHIPGKDPGKLARQIHRLGGTDITLSGYPDGTPPLETECILAWQSIPEETQNLPNLKAILSFGAGAEFLFMRPLPRQIALGRIVTPSLPLQMGRYLVAHALAHHRHLDYYQRQQQRQQWSPEQQHDHLAVGFLGGGAMAEPAALAFRKLGVPCYAYTRVSKPGWTDTVFHQTTDLPELARRSDVLINLLPNTAATQQLIDLRIFEAMPSGSLFIQAGRAAQLNYAALRSALDQGMLARAVLDVFPQEPLPTEDALWQHPKVVLTPHIAALSNYHEVAEQVVANLHRIRDNQPLTHALDRRHGY